MKMKKNMAMQAPLFLLMLFIASIIGVVGGRPLVVGNLVKTLRGGANFRPEKVRNWLSVQGPARIQMAIEEQRKEVKHWERLELIAKGVQYGAQNVAPPPPPPPPPGVPESYGNADLLKVAVSFISLNKDLAKLKLAWLSRAH